VNLPTYCLQNKRKNFWIAETKNRLRALRHSTELNLKIKYLREYEFIFKTALAHESGDPGVLFAEKTEGRKSRETVPLINVSKFLLEFFLVEICPKK
jgi:hypothetical protein